MIGRMNGSTAKITRPSHSMNARWSAFRKNLHLSLLFETFGWDPITVGMIGAKRENKKIW
jgi:hypothetical protein